MLVYTDIDHRLMPDQEWRENIQSLPVVIRVTQFTDESAVAFNEEMSRAQSTGQSLVPVVIESTGGDIFHLLRMMQSIDASKIPVATVVESHAMSSGAFLLAYGTEGYRYASPQATVMLHDICLSPADGGPDFVVATGKAYRTIQRKLFARLSRNIGRPADYIAKLISNHPGQEPHLTARRCLEHNIINTIGTPTLCTKVSVDFQWRVE